MVVLACQFIGIFYIEFKFIQGGDCIMREIQAQRDYRCCREIMYRGKSVSSRGCAGGQSRQCRACEDWEIAQGVLDKIITNFEIAENENVPICLGCTGMACVFLEIGQDVRTL